MNAAQQGERIKELEAEVKSHKELLVAIVVQHAAVVTETGLAGVRSFELFVHDEQRARVCMSDILRTRQDVASMATVIEVVRAVHVG